VYYRIANHYKFIMQQLFDCRRYERVIFVEDDMLFAPDFFSYFEATSKVLDQVCRSFPVHPCANWQSWQSFSMTTKSVVVVCEGQPVLHAHPLLLLEATSEIPDQVPVPRRVLLSADLQSARCLVFLLPFHGAVRCRPPAGAGSQLEGCSSPL